MSILSIINPINESPVLNGGIYGVVIGIVTNNKDDDNLGRVKLKFPWLSDQDESFWARLAVPMAGNSRGTFFLPEIDDEVLVIFEHGDINRPYVIGALWNSVDVPPIDNADGENNLRQIKSRSGHTLTFNDKNGEETFEIVDMTGSNKIIINSSQNSITVESAQDISIKAPDGNLIIEANEITIKSAAAMQFESGSSLDIKSSSAMKLKGSTIDLN